MQLVSLLEKLKMEHLSGQLDGVCEQASKRDLGYKEFLTEALSVEWRGRHQRGVESRLGQARFPWVKTLEQLDLSFQPSIDRKVVRELAGAYFGINDHRFRELLTSGRGLRRWVSHL